MILFKRLSALFISLLLPWSVQASICHINPATKSEAGHIAKIMWFFNPGCPACYKVETEFSSWLKKNMADIELVPVDFHPEWQPLSQAFYSLTFLKQQQRLFDQFFSAIQDQIIWPIDEASIEKWMLHHGISANQWQKAYHSPQVTKKLLRAKQLVSAYHVDKIPSFVILGQYQFDLGMLGSQWRKFPLNIAELLQQKSPGCNGRIVNLTKS